MLKNRDSRGRFKKLTPVKAQALTMVWTGIVLCMAFSMFIYQSIVSINVFFEQSTLYSRMFPLHIVITDDTKYVKWVGFFDIRAKYIISPEPTEVAEVKIETVQKSNKKLTKKEIVMNSKYPTKIDKIHQIESNRGNSNSGHHKYCESIGKSNEFGYAALDKFCFDSFEDSVIAVESWFDIELVSKNLEEALCYYNTGRAVEGCTYALTYTNIISRN